MELITSRHSVDGGHGDIFEITMNRPDMHNAVNGPMSRLFTDAWKEFRDNDDLAVAILHGAGEKAFCAGADLTALEELVNINANAAQKAEYPRTDSGPLGGSRIVQKKPVITVTQGYTYAGGLELFCHGHIRIAEKQALFSVACRRWGVPLIDGGTVYLPRLLGAGNALPLIITGQRIRASRAQEIGLVWEVTEKGKGLKRAFRMAEQIAQQPVDALRADLESAITGMHLPIEEALQLEAANTYPVIESESMKQGVASFNSGKRFWFL
ncbi:MAG: enoyl-CoA hydratase/isomerase family protein [Leptospiraceae bacterium]|nr:enoyl-CoA hydratase/isomerase family protein [Leptospiraceae bacterium]MCB1303746.1 enoyl-CoA hydratase/isomerase family protein [Leptospiraceae bacterium]